MINTVLDTSEAVHVPAALLQPIRLDDLCNEQSHATCQTHNTPHSKVGQPSCARHAHRSLQAHPYTA